MPTTTDVGTRTERVQDTSEVVFVIPKYGAVGYAIHDSGHMMQFSRRLYDASPRDVQHTMLRLLNAAT